MAIPDVRGTRPGSSARERIVAAAYELFTRRGIRAVGMDEVIERAGVARATVYRHFGSKDELVLAVLQRRKQLWTYDLIEEQSRLRGNTPEDQLLAIFDVLHEWFHHADGYDGCSFIKVLLEMGAAHPAGQASIAYMEELRTIMRQRAQAAGLRDTDDFARSLHILAKGAMIAATEGDLAAAHRAQNMARALIEEHRPAVPSHI
ncbi:MAG: TetR/AcrR family transcriptional regulator [Mycobacterium sp.]|nr:TetR/AcrR family transcriptional regulator [Mycobacterium sp.]